MAQVASTDKQDIQLLKDEEATMGLMIEEGIATISFYKGDFKSAVEAIRSQFALVVASNPWLTGRLVKTKGGARLRHPASPSTSDIDSLFTTTSAEDTAAFKLTPTSPYTEMCTNIYASKKVIVGRGSSILDKDERVAILTISESTPGNFALIFSISHVIGDGRTYYEIFKMLQPGIAVRKLTSTRILSFAESMRDTCGRKELEWSYSLDATCLFTCAMLPAIMGCTKKAKCVAFHLDSDRVAKAKIAATSDSDVPYVSTNDVLTSGFFNECRARIGYMAMDCRERLEGLDKDLAGNYVTALTMDSGTFATPATVRKMLSSTPYETTKKPLPRCCGWFCGKESANMAMATNWSSFAGGMVQLEECEMVIHLPLQNPVNCVFDLMIPFASNVGKMGVICWTVSTDEEGLREALPVGERVSNELFP